MEIGALVDCRAMFSTVVHPGCMPTHLDDTSVHGIPHEELLRGPSFGEAFARLDQFLQYAALSVLDSDEASEDGRSQAAMSLIRFYSIQRNAGRIELDQMQLFSA